MPLKIVSPNVNLDFVRFAKVAVVVSIIGLLASLGLIGMRGLNFGVDFTGGALIQIRTSEVQDVGAIRNALADYQGLTLQEYGAEDEFLLRLPLQENSGNMAQNLADQVAASLRDSFGEVQIRRVEFVGPQIGEELRQQGILAVLASLVVILIYVTARFELRYGIGALAALAHDVLLTVGVFALLQKEVTLPVLAAVLTIIGYSLNDTIVVFDRVREQRRKEPKQPFASILNLALNKTLGRTIMTSVTTLLVLLALFVFGGPVIHDFAFALLFGVVVGTYSSICISGPVLLVLEGYTKRLQEKMDAILEENPENSGADKVAKEKQKP